MPGWWTVEWDWTNLWKWDTVTDVCSNQLCMSLCAHSIEWQLKHFTGYNDTNSVQAINNFCSLCLGISFLYRICYAWTQFSQAVHLLEVVCYLCQCWCIHYMFAVHLLYIMILFIVTNQLHITHLQYRQSSFHCLFSILFQPLSKWRELHSSWHLHLWCWLDWNAVWNKWVTDWVFDWLA